MRPTNRLRTPKRREVAYGDLGSSASELPSEPGLPVKGETVCSILAVEAVGFYKKCMR